jgi:hypothetical protein
LTTTRLARKRPAESLCQPPARPSRGSEATTFAPRPRALKRPVLPPSRPSADRSPPPIRRGSPPALRTAIWTCFKNDCVRRLTRAPPLRDRPGLTRKFSLSSLVITRRLTSERARTRAAEHRSRQIASTRIMRAPSLGSLKSRRELFFAAGHAPRAVPLRRHGKVQKNNVQTSSSDRSRTVKTCEPRFALSSRHSSSYFLRTSLISFNVESVAPCTKRSVKTPADLQRSRIPEVI